MIRRTAGVMLALALTHPSSDRALAVSAPVAGSDAPGQRVTYDYDPGANFPRYRTYAWTRGTELLDELNHSRVVRAVEARLATKGLAKVDASATPDVLVAYHASFERNLEITGFSTGWGPFDLGGHRSATARLQEILVGTLVVDITDARTSALVWRGVATGDIKPTDKPEKRDNQIAKATNRMFQNFPPKPSAQ
jgi:hypothetical protein